MEDLQDDHLVTLSGLLREKNPAVPRIAQMLDFPASAGDIVEWGANLPDGAG